MRVAILTLLLAVATGCGEPHGAPLDYALVTQARSPNGRLRAVVVRQRNRGTGSDPYFVDIWPSARMINQDALASVREHAAIFYGTNLDHAQLIWPADTLLTVHCADCAPSDIEKAVDQDGKVHIIYDGFGPPH